MSQNWHCLLIPGADPAGVAAALHDQLAVEHYAPYDPFPGGTGTPPRLRDMVRHFVAPAQDGWVRVLGEPDPAILPALNAQLGRDVLYGWLDDNGGGFSLWRDGTSSGEPEALVAYLAPDYTPDDLRRALAGAISVPVIESDNPPVLAIGADALPPDIQQLAQEKDINPDKANKLFEKISGSLFNRLPGRDDPAASADLEQARALVSGEQQDIWNSLAGQRVRATANLLALPGNWRLPAWDTVREAYQVHRLRQRSPRMPLMPGDKEALKTVPDALDYLPIYMGR